MSPRSMSPRGPGPEDPLGSGASTLDAGSGGPRIRCPKCAWQPRARDRWCCECLHAWNTFDTRGRCPACGKVWRETQCLACHAFSPHEAWYEERKER